MKTANLGLLGRKAKLDSRDQKYLIKDHFKFGIKVSQSLKKRHWNSDGWWGDQGDTPYCVGYAWAHWIEDGPVGHDGPVPITPPLTIYENAQRLDEWEGENYDGTSVRGGVKYLKSTGIVKSYYWAYDIDTIAQWILNYGPIVVGTDWYNAMFFPDRTGLVRAVGRVAGGHAYVLNGVDLVKKQFRIKNSWGRSWGRMGFAYINFGDMAKLLANQGEACIAVEATDAQLNS